MKDTKNWETEQKKIRRDTIQKIENNTKSKKGKWGLEGNKRSNKPKNDRTWTPGGGETEIREGKAIAEILNNYIIQKLRTWKTV